jgi:hypothetical protein
MPSLKPTILWGWKPIPDLRREILSSTLAVILLPFGEARASAKARKENWEPGAVDGRKVARGSHCPFGRFHPFFHGHLQAEAAQGFGG